MRSRTPETSNAFHSMCAPQARHVTIPDDGIAQGSEKNTTS
jgi:hypothetical protein